MISSMTGTAILAVPVIAWMVFWMRQVSRDFRRLRSARRELREPGRQGQGGED